MFSLLVNTFQYLSILLSHFSHVLIFVYGSHIFILFILVECVWLVLECVWVLWKSQKVGEGWRKSEKVRESVKKMLEKGRESPRKSEKVRESVRKYEKVRESPRKCKNVWESVRKCEKVRESVCGTFAFCRVLDCPQEPKNASEPAVLSQGTALQLLGHRSATSSTSPLKECVNNFILNVWEITRLLLLLLLFLEV